MDNRISANVQNIRQSLELHHESHGKWKEELTIGRQTPTVVKIHSEIFGKELLSPLQYVIARMPLNYVIRKCKKGYKYIHHKKIYHLTYKDDIKMFAKKKHKTKTGDSDTNNKNIQPRYRKGVWH